MNFKTDLSYALKDIYRNFFSCLFMVLLLIFCFRYVIAVGASENSISPQTKNIFQTIEYANKVSPCFVRAFPGGVSTSEELAHNANAAKYGAVYQDRDFCLSFLTIQPVS